LNLRTILALSLGICFSVYAPTLGAAPNSGKISGVVLDPSGTAQMGATVLISSEQVLNASSQLELLTNDHGRFSTSAVPAGSYSIKVTLAGFLPAMERHVEVSDQRTTLLEVVLGSVFSSFGKLRQQPNQQPAQSDWTWALRASAATRSVLQWQDAGPQVTVLGQAKEETVSPQEARAQLLLSSGSDHPGSVGALSDSPGTAFAYDMGVGEGAELLMAGQFSSEGGASAESFAGEWLPSGKAGVGPLTTVVLRQSQLGPSGPTFRGLRMSHDDQLTLTDRVAIRYGGEFLVADFMNRVAIAVRPRGEADIQLGLGWEAAAIVAARPWGNYDSGTPTGTDSALDALDVFPTVLLRKGRPVVEDDVHEELAMERAWGENAHLSVALFHDGGHHTAVIGRGGSANEPDFLQDYFSQAFAYDAGSSGSWGTRAAYTEKLSQDVDTALVYTYGGVLAPDGKPGNGTLQSQLSTQSRHSLATRTSARVPRLKTKLTAGYNWISGPAVSQQDPYGESFYRIDPYLSLQVKQPIPGFFSGHMEVEADAGNLLAQGYVPVSTSRGQVVLVPSYRYFRGGLSLQF
jgi:carboxypeptidase family protein